MHTRIYGMATIPVVLVRLARTRRRVASEDSGRRFEEFEPAYRRIFEAVEEAGGEAAVDALAAWAVAETEMHARLPAPQALRRAARRELDAMDVEIAQSSALYRG